MIKEIGNKIYDIRLLHNNVPDGIITDADTILVDIVAQADCEISGLAEGLFSIWELSTDKYSVEEVFYNLTGVEFIDYLDMCLDNITR